MNQAQWIMANCKFAKRQKLASISLYVADHVPPKEAKTTYQLAWDIAEPLFVAMQKLLPPEVFAAWRSKAGPEYFTIDGLDTDATEGLLNFYVPNLKMEHVQKLIPAINYLTKEFGAEIGRPIFETHGQKLQTLKEQGDERLPQFSEMFKGKENELRVVRFPAKILPRKSEDRPPELNLSIGNAKFIFQDILNLSSEQTQEPWSIDAAELLMKIGTARSGLIQQRIEEENRARQQQEEQSKGKIKLVVPPVDEEYVERVLDQIEAIAKWALAHHYSSIEAV